MKIAKYASGTALVLAMLACGTAWADHGHGHSRVEFGINLGVPFAPWYYPPYYYPPYYYPNPPLVAVPTYPYAVQPAPQVYIEKGGEVADAPAQATNYWYYCPNPQGYYPYVKECPSGWMTVLPQSPGPR